MNKLTYVLVIALVALATAGMAFASPANVSSSSAAYIESIKVDGNVYENRDTIKTDLGETLNIRLKIQADQDVSNLEASARLTGYDYNTNEKVSDVSRTFDLKDGDTEYVDLQIVVPLNAEKDKYELRVSLDGRRENYGNHVFTVRLSGPKSSILIRDVLVTPSGSIEAGRSLLVQARLENIGEKDQDNVKVTVSIPNLNVEQSVYMNALDGENFLGRGEKKTSEEIYLRVPPCAKPGKYDLVTAVSFDEYEDTSKTQQITIVGASELCASQNTISGNTNTQAQKVIVTAPSAQTVQIGVGGASFPVVIQNNAGTAKTFVVSVTGVSDWGSYQISDAAPVVNAGATKVVYIYVTAMDGALAGAKTFGIDVTVDGEKHSMTAQAILTQTESSASGMSWKTIFTTMAVILLIVVLVLVIVLAVRKMKGGDGEEDDLESKGQAYY